MNVIPGKPISRSRIRAAITILGVDPDQCTSAEIGKNGVEFAWFNTGEPTYSTHTVTEDDDRLETIIVNVRHLDLDRIERLQAVIAALVDEHEQVPF